MGKYRFRLSDMIPNSWFYKLTDMSRPTTRTTTTTKHPSKRLLNSPRPTPPPPTKTQLYTPNRPSNYISSEHLEPPRKSKKKHRRSCGSSSGSGSGSKKPVTNPTTNSPSSSASTYENDDITIDIKSLSLHPIHTKPAEREDVELDSKQIMLRRQALHRIRVRPATPKIDVRRGRRRLEESLVIVKRSGDPKGDFRASMVEMIVENDIGGAKEMEELLACYLSLNSDVYHDLIVQVFEEIWVDLAAPEM